MQWFSKIIRFWLTGIATVQILHPTLNITIPIEYSSVNSLFFTSYSRNNLSSKANFEQIKVRNNIVQDWKDWKEGTDIAQNILSSVAIIVGGIWVVYKFGIFREKQLWIQFDIDLNLYKLSCPINDVTIFTWDKPEKPLPLTKSCTHVVEVLLKFTNKGKTRFRLYNLQIEIKTMPQSKPIKISKRDGHLSLERVFKSGNIIPIMQVEDLPTENTSFYYIEPEVEQTIHYLALITEPRELLQVVGKFSLEQKRVFPYEDREDKKVFPHTAARTYHIDKNGCLEKGKDGSSA